MVWIYGGGFLVGGSMGANFLDNYLYSGQEIADGGDVIVCVDWLPSGNSGFPQLGGFSNTTYGPHTPIQ